MPFSNLLCFLCSILLHRPYFLCQFVFEWFSKQTLVSFLFILVRDIIFYGVTIQGGEKPVPWHVFYNGGSMIWISILYKYSVILLIYFFNCREDLLVQCWGFCIPFTLRLFLLRKVGTVALSNLLIPLLFVVALLCQSSNWGHYSTFGRMFFTNLASRPSSLTVTVSSCHFILLDSDHFHSIKWPSQNNGWKISKQTKTLKLNWYSNRPGRDWRTIARAHAHTRHILFSCAIIARQFYLGGDRTGKPPLRCLLLLHSSLTLLPGHWDRYQSCKCTLGATFVIISQHFLITRHKSFGRATIARCNVKHVLWLAIAARVAFYSRPDLWHMNVLFLSAIWLYYG